MVRDSVLVALVWLSGPAWAGPTPARKEATVTPAALSATLTGHLDAWAADGKPSTIGEIRSASYDALAGWIAEKKAKGQPAHLLFVCTHNSRRSHMGQLWGAAAAHHAGLSHVQTWSGGTEATAFNPRSVTALSGHGFGIEDSGAVAPAGKNNVVYTTTLGDGLAPISGFSKVYSDAHNPSSGFAAIMVCTSADAACPFVEGAELRVSVPFVDPKGSDGTPEETATYRAKSEEIGRELRWLMEQAAQR